jgi:hypothetical protein
MTRCHYLFSLCLLASFPLHAGYVEFAQWMPWSFLSAELRKNEILIHETKDELSFSVGEIRPKLSQVNLLAAGNFSGLSYEQGKLFANGKVSFQIEISSLVIDQIIAREFGGNVLEVHLEASCAPITLTVSEVAIESAFHFPDQNENLPTLNGFSYHVPANGWALSPLSCQGLSNLGPEIESGIRSALTTPGVFQNLIRDSLTPSINQWIRNVWPLESEWSGFEIAAPDERGFFIRGELSLSGDQEIVLPENFPFEDAPETPRFYLSRDGFTAVIADRMKKILPQIYDLRSNEGFAKLLHSKFLQFLLWPDLMRFPSQTPFVLKNDPSSLKLALKGEAFSWIGQVTEKGSMWTLVGGSPIEYLTYQLSLSLPITISLTGGDILLHTSTARVSASWDFGYLYRMIYRPQKRIPLSLLTGAVATLVSGKNEILKLPRFRLGNREYILSNFLTTDQFITMDWL